MVYSLSSRWPGQSHLILRWFAPHPPGSCDQQAEKHTDEQADGSPIETSQPVWSSGKPACPYELRLIHLTLFTKPSTIDSSYGADDVSKLIHIERNMTKG